MFLPVTMIALLAGCSHDTRPVPDTFSGSELYKNYHRRDHGYPMSTHDAGVVLGRTDLKSTGDFHTNLPGDSGNIRFIYGRKYYWAYHNNPWSPRDEPHMYGPFDLP